MDLIGLARFWTADRYFAGGTDPDPIGRRFREGGPGCIEADVVAFDPRRTSRRGLFFDFGPQQVNRCERIRVTGEDVAAVVAFRRLHACFADIGADLVVGGINFREKFELVRDHEVPYVRSRRGSVRPDPEVIAEHRAVARSAQEQAAVGVADHIAFVGFRSTNYGVVGVRGDEDTLGLFFRAFNAVEFEPDPVVASFESFPFDCDPDLSIADRQALDRHVVGANVEALFSLDPHTGPFNAGVGFALATGIAIDRQLVLDRFEPRDFDRAVGLFPVESTAEEDFVRNVGRCV